MRNISLRKHLHLIEQQTDDREIDQKIQILSVQRYCENDYRFKVSSLKL